MLRAEGVRAERGGFAVVVVVLLLFAIAMAGAAGYQAVQVEAELSTQQADADAARTIAEAGLARYVGEQLGVPGDSVSYVVGEGTAVIRARRVAVVDSVTEVYVIRSTGSVADPKWSGAPARRTVSQYALLHKDPVGIHAALSAAANAVHLRLGAKASGVDAASPGGCSVARMYDTAGVMNFGVLTTQPGGSVSGTPNQVVLPDQTAFLDTLRLSWEVLESPDFPIEHDGAPPNWFTVAADSFPVVRATEDLNADLFWSGRGVLIVPGEFDVSWFFSWEGIVLAGSLDSNLWPFFSGSSISGMLIGGLDGSQGSVTIRGMDVEYDSCSVLAASASLAYLEVLNNAWWEEW